MIALLGIGMMTTRMLGGRGDTRRVYGMILGAILGGGLLGDGAEACGGDLLGDGGLAGETHGGGGVLRSVGITRQDGAGLTTAATGALPSTQGQGVAGLIPHPIALPAPITILPVPILHPVARPLILLRAALQA